ncbi:hypothetical protein N7495_002548 [Penicillium taxi]|uniref:uncharacterized protein n=1 Tax=Penicillium taxi TaxID=168475 RepID=UPI00254523B1|nr:uncharacterized protein N7495_002548 [Penicillium taxi]KAJ5902020.1 hypothetical protein N7495_002548 [Penicillium taxi]
MKLTALRIQRGRPISVCQFCQFSTSRRLPFSRFPTTSESVHRLALALPKINLRPQLILPVLSSRNYASNSETIEAQSVIRGIQQEVLTVHNAEVVPSNEVILAMLQRCHKIAESLVSQERGQNERDQNESSSNEGNAISPLLNMEEGRGKSLDPRLADSISEIATGLLKDEKVFISPEALEIYTKTLVLLQRAEHFPEIFNLYANKPVPEENSSPIKFHKADPKSVKSAIPAELANEALDIAIAQKNLSLVLAIIDNTFCAPAFHRAKVLKKAGVPLAGLAAAPLACYALASMASNFQNTMDASTATGLVFAASLAYVGGAASLGIISITSANDQMERVVWLPGVPLRHRWLREEERAAMDRVAVTWGFKDPYLRGEEVGEEWEALREFIGMRGMILDKTELMEGMQ